MSLGEDPDPGISGEIADERFRPFDEVDLLSQPLAGPDGTRVSPHDRRPADRPRLRHRGVAAGLAARRARGGCAGPAPAGRLPGPGRSARGGVADGDFAAATMRGWWFPGRQIVIVLPLAAIAIARWVGVPSTERTRRRRLMVAGGWA